MGSLKPIMDAEADHLSSFLQDQESTSPLQVSPGSPTQPGLSLGFHPLRFPEGEEQTLPGESCLSEDSSLFSDLPSPQDHAVTQLSLQRPLVSCHILLPVPVQCEREDWVL